MPVNGESMSFIPNLLDQMQSRMVS
jgi:hypothetical protein